MIPANEFLIKDIIQCRLAQLSANPNLLDGIFMDNANSIVPKLKELFKNPDRIKVIMGFPREPSQLPCYVITLGQSAQQEAGLGMNLDVEELEYSGTIRDYDISLKPAVLEEKGTFNVYIQLPEIIGVINRISQKEQTVDNFVVVDEQKGIIRLLDSWIDPEQEVDVNYCYPNRVTRTRGAMFSETYRIECWSDNGDLAAYMFYILKWTLLSSIQTMTENGFILPTLQGQDFEPVPDYFPTFVYRRSMNILTRVENSWEEWDEALNIRSTQFNVQGYVPDRVDITIGGENNGSE